MNPLRLILDHLRSHLASAFSQSLSNIKETGLGAMNTTQKYAWKKRQYKPKRTMKRMNCSPAVKQSSVNNSCYTPKILSMIRDAYNKDHPTTRIDETDPTKLWQILNDRFVQCNKEDCWLNELKDANLKKKIDRYIFAPDKPYEWKKEPNAWLSNYDIMNVLEQYEETYRHFEFIGPTPIDFDKVVGKTCVQNELCKFRLSEHINRGKTHIGIIFNLSPSTSDGSHWVSLFIDVKERVIFFFDSAGANAPAQIKAFIKRVQNQAVEKYGRRFTYFKNFPKEHQMGNTECGVYSLFFIITMLTSTIPSIKVEREMTSSSVLKKNGGLKLKTETPMNMRQKKQLFLKEKISDEYIEQYRNVYFNE
jgi:hypothetical protein